MIFIINFSLNSMNLSESYIERIKLLSGVLSESVSMSQYNYQIRDIGGDVFYKKLKDDECWQFTSELDFCKNSNKDNVIDWIKPEANDKYKVKQVEIKQDLNYQKHPMETYKRYLENICPPNFKVEIVGNHIKVSKD